MAEYPESAIRAAVAARLHQGMDDEEVYAVEQEVRAELAAEPPIEPMSKLGVAIVQAGGWSEHHTQRDEEAYRLATQQNSSDDIEGE